jgi:hypothetical protein
MLRHDFTPQAANSLPVYRPVPAVSTGLFEAGVRHKRGRQNRTHRANKESTICTTAFQAASCGKGALVHHPKPKPKHRQNAGVSKCWMPILQDFTARDTLADNCAEDLAAFSLSGLNSLRSTAQQEMDSFILSIL